MSDAADLRAGDVAAMIRRHRLVAVLRRIAPRDHLVALVDELADAGVRSLEITLDAPAGADDLRAVRERLAERSDGPFIVGAGTVTTASQLDAALAAGADFAIAPLLDVTLVTGAIDRGLPFIPGALTPSEIASAWNAGATFVKLFPASAVGPAFVRELRGPMPQVELIPTGGVDARTAKDYLSAGAAAVGIGSALTAAAVEQRRDLVRSVIGATG